MSVFKCDIMIKLFIFNFKLILLFFFYFLVIEGVSLYNENINPYDGDLFHETPLALVFFSYLTSSLSDFYVNLVFIACDIFTAFVLYYTSKIYTENLVCKKKKKYSCQP